MLIIFDLIYIKLNSLITRTFELKAYIKGFND